MSIPCTYTYIIQFILIWRICKHTVYLSYLHHVILYNSMSMCIYIHMFFLVLDCTPCVSQFMSAVILCNWPYCSYLGDGVHIVFISIISIWLFFYYSVFSFALFHLYLSFDHLFPVSDSWSAVTSEWWIKTRVFSLLAAVSGSCQCLTQTSNIPFSRSLLKGTFCPPLRVKHRLTRSVPWAVELAPVCLPWSVCVTYPCSPRGSCRGVRLVFFSIAKGELILPVGCCSWISHTCSCSEGFPVFVWSLLPVATRRGAVEMWDDGWVFPVSATGWRCPPPPSLCVCVCFFMSRTHIS